jgi:hypothetical protein
MLSQNQPQYNIDALGHQPSHLSPKYNTTSLKDFPQLSLACPQPNTAVLESQKPLISPASVQAPPYHDPGKDPGELSLTTTSEARPAKLPDKVTPKTGSKEMTRAEMKEFSILHIMQENRKRPHGHADSALTGNSSNSATHAPFANKGCEDEKSGCGLQHPIKTTPAIIAGQSAKNEQGENHDAGLSIDKIITAGNGEMSGKSAVTMDIPHERNQSRDSLDDNSHRERLQASETANYHQALITYLGGVISFHKFCFLTCNMPPEARRMHHERHTYAGKTVVLMA